MKDTRIYWRYDAEHIKVSHAEWNSLVDMLEADGYTESSGYKTTKRHFPPGTYRFDDDKKNKDLYAVNWDNELIHFYTQDDDSKNDEEHISGGRAFKEINMRFMNLYHTSFTAAFGVWSKGELDTNAKSKEKEYHYELEQCNEALPAIIQCDDFFNNKLLENVYKADISSAYPYELTLPIPTMKGMLGPYKGAVEPEYGYVAYWIKSGHIIESIEGGADTRNLLNQPLYRDRHNFKPIDYDNEITYLLPYSEYDLAPIISDLYNNRQSNPFNKGVMNSFIGMLRSRKYYQRCYMGHISALVYARHIDYMCQLDTILKINHCYPIMYATDSIMWLGGPCAIADSEKYLGSFTLEYENCRAAYKSCGNYVIEDKSKNALGLVKHQGIAEAAWIKSGINSIEAYLATNIFLKSERFNHKTHKYELYDIVEV